MTSAARSALSRSAFSAVEVVAITRAPKTRANCSAKTETPPEPWIRTVSPGVTRRWPVSATQAVTAAQGRVAASSKDRWLGRSTTASSLKTAYSASIPSRLPPSPVGQVVGLDRSAKPARMKATGNPVANFDPSNSFTDRCDLAGAVGQRHYADLRWTATTAFEDHQIAVAERARADPHEGLLRPGPRILARPQYDSVNAAKAFDAIGFHLSFPVMPNRPCLSCRNENAASIMGRFRVPEETCA